MQLFKYFKMGIHEDSIPSGKGGLLHTIKRRIGGCCLGLWVLVKAI